MGPRKIGVANVFKACFYLINKLMKTGDLLKFIGCSLFSMLQLPSFLKNDTSTSSLSPANVFQFVCSEEQKRGRRSASNYN